MLLCIDAGNTNTLFAVHDGDTFRARWRIHTHSARTADEYRVWLGQLLSQEGIRPADIQRTVISSVVPQATFNLKELARSFFKCRPLVVGDNDVALGVEIRIDNPRQVGADRIVNAAAGHKAYKGALILVDFGTATTFDVVSADGAYEGGIIAPGVNLSVEALHMAAAQLPRIAVQKPQKVIGTDTVSAMTSGVFWGYVGMIEGLIARIRAEYGSQGELTAVATGGLAALFHGTTDSLTHLAPDLTLDGLLEISRRNPDWKDEIA